MFPQGFQIHSTDVSFLPPFLERCRGVRERLNICSEKICAIEEEIDHLDARKSFLSERVVELRQKLTSEDQKIHGVYFRSKAKDSPSTLDKAFQAAEKEERNIIVQLEKLAQVQVLIEEEQNGLQEEIEELSACLAREREGSPNEAPCVEV